MGSLSGAAHPFAVETARGSPDAFPPMLGKPKELEGVLLVDKPTGFTSHDVVARLRRKLAMKRIGHAGTLDPMATGLLIMLIGKATRISQYLTNLDKEYEGTIELGKITNSQDADGEVMETRPVPALTEAEVRAAMQTFLGDQYQTPPMFSAIKVGGVPLYKMARKGEEIVREPRFIRVSAYELTRFALPHLDFRMRCSKGTYVRTLAHDLGQKLGCGGHLCALRRTATDRFRIESALPLDQIEQLPVTEIEKRLLPVYDVVPSVVG
jgi:tRNA pseudouridine55 synthase